MIMFTLQMANNSLETSVKYMAQSKLKRIFKMVKSWFPTIPQNSNYMPIFS